MKNGILLIVFTLVLAFFAQAQMKVASYAFGKPGTDQYEHFGFWTNDGKRTEIIYTYGKDRKEMKLQYLGTDNVKGDSCFKVRFSNNYLLYIIPKGLQLKATDARGKYNKTFAWEYEGPVNGVGTYCNVCAEDEKEAMELVRSAYMN